MKVGDKVQVWDDEGATCLGWGTITHIAKRVKDQEEVGYIELESGKKVWSNMVFWIPEKKAVEIGVRVFKAVKGEAK